MADKYFVIANKSLKVGDFKVKSSIFVLSEHRLHFVKSVADRNRFLQVFHYPLSEATKLKSWYDSEGIETYMAAIVSGMTPSANNGSRSMYSDRVCLSHFTTNPYLGEEKVLLTLLFINI